MWKALLLVAGLCAFAQGQQHFDYYDYLDAEPVAAAPPPPPSRPRSSVARAPPPRAPSRPPPQGQVQQQHANDPNTTPVPIVTDVRRIDTKTGGFVYQYAGADGSAKYEIRLPNGTVIGNYTFVNDLGEQETRWYTAGVQDPSLVDETTDPNYVDLSNYDLYKHLEQPYVHDGGLDESFGPQQSRPRAQVPRPGSGGNRPSAPRPSAPRAPPPPPPPPRGPPPPPRGPPPPPPPPSSRPLDFDDPSLHFIEPVPLFEGVPPEPHSPLPPPPPPPGPQPGRGRPGGRVRVQSRPAAPPRHRLDAQSDTDAFLDSLISRFS